MGREEDDLSTQEQLFDEKEHIDFNANLAQEESSTMIPIDQLPPIPVSEEIPNKDYPGGDFVE